MLDFANAEFSECVENDTAKETTLYFDLPDEQAAALAEGLYRNEYEQALAGIGYYDPHEIVPHMELQISYLQDAKDKEPERVELGIGIHLDGCTEVLDLVALTEGEDYRTKDMHDLFTKAIEADKQREPER